MSLRIIHFSDLHLTKDTIDNKATEALLNNLIQSMDEVEKDGKIDLVIFTGDMVDKGGTSFGDIKYAFVEFDKMVIEPIMKKFKLPKERFVFIPGNHDAENDDEKALTRNGMLNKNFHDDYEKIINLKNSTQGSYPKMLRARTKAFKEFEKSYYSDKLNENYKYGDFESNYKFTINGMKVGLTSLNSVWLCGLGEDKEFYLGADQVINSKTFLSDCDIKIVASHIGYDLLTEGESRYVKKVLTNCYDLNLSGHTHRLDDGFTTLPSDDFCMNIISAGTLCNNVYAADEEHKNSFQVIEIISKEEFIIRKYFQKQSMEFTLDLNFGNKGIWHIKYDVKNMSAAIAKEVEEQVDEQKKLLDNIKPFKPINVAIQFDKETFMSGDFIRTKRNEECITVLKDKSIKNVRLLALSGIGKTRIVGEAFKGMSNVFYSKTTENIDTGIIYILENFDNGIIVLDDCSIDKYYRAVKFVSSYQKQFKLISIYNVLTIEEVGIGQNEFFIDAKDNEKVVDAVIEREGITDANLKAKIKEYSDGISLMAIELIKAYKHMGGVQLLPEKKQWLAYLLHPEGKLDVCKRSVLNTIAVFNPLGYTGGKKDEYDFVINHPEINHIQLNKCIVQECFSGTVNEFNQRRLLDMRANSVNVRPRLLAEWLAEEWLQKTPYTSWPDIISALEAAGQLGERLTRQMQNRLRSMMSVEAKKLFDELNKTPFHDEKIVLTKTGSQLIFSMSTVSQTAVAHNLFSLFEEKTTDYLNEKISGDIRRNLVWALEESCVNAEAFEEACKLLGMLAVAENENISNNATGIFLEKFHVILSGTQADLSKRENVMRFMFDKGVEFYTLLVKAINNAFETRSNYHTLTYTERKFDIKPKTSVDMSELRRYWTFCKDLLIKMSEDDASLKEIYKLIPNHVYDLVYNGCEEILFDMIGYFSPKYNNDWDEMRRFLGMIKNYNAGAYERSKQHIDLLINDVLAPKTFMKKIKAAMSGIDRKNPGSGDIFDVYEAVMRPYGVEFIEKKIYNSNEFGDMADNNDFDNIWIVRSAVKVMKERNCRDEVYASFMRHIESKPKDYQSSFIENYLRRDYDKKYLNSIAKRLIRNGYYLMACKILGMIDDNNYNYGQLHRIFGMIHEGKMPSMYINNYLRFNTCSNIDDIFKVSDMLFENEEVDKVEVAYPHLFQYLFTMKEEQIRPYLPKCEKRLLDFDFSGDKFYFARQVVEHIESILKTYNEPDFAKKVNNIVIEFSKIYRHFANNPFEDLYFSLLPKYQDVILDDVIEVLAAPLDQSMFYLNMNYHLGSGSGYGSGPLFQCDNEKLKVACEKYPDTLPERLANMCPVCNFDNDGMQMGLSDFFLWLADNYGDDEKVLQSFDSNFGTYSYIGVGSMKGYFINRQNLFKPLFLHKNPNVVKWAKSMYKSEGQQADYQQIVDDYRDMTSD